METTEHYTNRYIEENVVQSIVGNEVTSTSGWTARAPEDLVPLLKVGEPYVLETLASMFGTITGWHYQGVWYGRRSDEKIEADRVALRESIDREHIELLEANREDWTRREALLPDWLKARIQTFHEKGGEKFERNGWGYELTVCELAVLYDRMGLPAKQDSQAIMDYAKEHGTSGNQHDIARALVQAHDRGIDISNTVSALSPITGDAFYDGK